MKDIPKLAEMEDADTRVPGKLIWLQSPRI